MNREDVLKIVKESYEQGQSDLIESCKEAAAKVIEVAIAAEREACAKMAEELNEIGHSYGLEDRIRARGNT